MKLLPLALLSACTLFVLPVQAQLTEQQIMSEAQTAYIRGDLQTAKKQFELVRRINPRNQVAINYLRMITVAEQKAPRGNEMEAQLSKVVLPKIELRDATLGSALDFVRQQVTKVTEGKTSISFVVQLPADQVNTQQVTLVLNNVPVTEVLKYLGDLAGVRFTYEKYAIRVTPAGGAVSGTTPPPPPTVTQPPIQ